MLKSQDEIIGLFSLFCGLKESNMFLMKVRLLYALLVVLSFIVTLDLMCFLLWRDMFIFSWVQNSTALPLTLTFIGVESINYRIPSWHMLLLASLFVVFENEMIQSALDGSWLLFSPSDCWCMVDGKIQSTHDHAMVRRWYAEGSLVNSAQNQLGPITSRPKTNSAQVNNQLGPHVLSYPFTILCLVLLRLYNPLLSFISFIQSFA